MLEAFSGIPKSRWLAAGALAVLAGVLNAFLIRGIGLEGVAVYATICVVGMIVGAGTVLILWGRSRGRRGGDFPG